MRRSLVSVKAWSASVTLPLTQASYSFKVFQNSGATVTRVLGLNGPGNAEIVGSPLERNKLTESQQ